MKRPGPQRHARIRFRLAGRRAEQLRTRRIGGRRSHRLLALWHHDARHKLLDIQLLNLRVAQNFIEKLGALLALVDDRRKRQHPPPARQRHVKQTPLLKLLIIAFRLLLFQQPRREFEHRPPHARWKISLAEMQDENVGEFEPLGRVNGHQLHRVVHRLFLQENIAVGFFEEIQVIEKIMKRAAIAFLLPLLHEFF